MGFKREIEDVSAKLPEFIPKGCAEAFKILGRELAKGTNANILDIYDPDIDGLMAGLMVQNYLDQLGIKSRYCINSNRAHGFLLTDSQLASMRGGLIIAVDFSITKAQFDKILQFGVNLISIDHHEINVRDYSKTQNFVYAKCGDAYGVILNNQYESEPESCSYLSGAGMVYHFLKYVSKNLEVPLYSDYAAMVGISLLSDIRLLEQKEPCMFLQYTFNLKTDYMKYLQWLVTDESKSSQRFEPFGIPCICRNFIDYTFSPIINSFLRANKSRESVELLKGTQEFLDIYRKDNNLYGYRNGQKKMIESIMKSYKESENIVGSLNKKYNNLICCVLDNDFNPHPGFNVCNYIGVACSKIKDEDKTGAIFVIDKETKRVIRGSVRGGTDGVDYLSIFQKNGVPSAGHHNAFGILSCNIMDIDFDKISEDIFLAEEDFKRKSKTTRHVIAIDHLYSFIKSPQGKQICKLNDYCRDNHRIYIKFLGDTDDKSRVRAEKISPKYTKYFIDEVAIDCFDPSLDIKDAFIVPSRDNQKYPKFTLRPSFEYNLPMNNYEFMQLWGQIFGS